MHLVKFLIAFVIVLAPWSPTFADSGSASISCSGNLKLCNANGYCENEYFYLYAYQYAYVYNGVVQSENHSFSFSGALGSAEDYVLQPHVSGRHLIYNGPRLSVAIPYLDEGDGIYAAQGIGGPSRSSWQRLCD